MMGGGQEKTDMIQSGCVFFLYPVFYGEGHQMKVWCLFYWGGRKRKEVLIK